MGFLQSFTVKTTRLRILFDVKQGVNCAAHGATNQLFFVELL